MPDALRAAVDRTLSAAGRSARAGTTALGSRPADLLDELARRGGQARDLVERLVGRESKGKP